MTVAKEYYCYIMASQTHGTLYTGVTSDLLKRVYEHKTGQGDFTAKYSVNRLVWYEHHIDINLAIQREKQIKKWKRAWKQKMISNFNSDWDDLYPMLSGELG